MEVSSKSLLPLADDGNAVEDDGLPTKFDKGRNNDDDDDDDTAETWTHESLDESHRRSKRPFSSRSLQAVKRSGVTIDRLRFQELQIHGRAAEQEKILSCLTKISKDDSEKEKPKSKSKSKTKQIKQLVLISGVSGTGKTTLTMTLQKPVVRMGGIFAMGKYDLHQRSEPYLGISVACEQIFMQMQVSDSSSESNSRMKKLDAFRNDLLEDLGDGLGVLTTVVPSIVEYVLKGLVREYSSESDSEEFGYGPGRHETKAKMHFAFRKLFRALCKHFSPIVVALDDLQWADVASLELLEDLLSDRKNRHLMVVGLYRSDEVLSDSLLSKTLAILKKQTSKGLLEMTEISTGNIDVEGVNGIISDLLSVDSSPATMELATVCHRRTRGNVFFVLSFLRMLDDKGFLAFNFGAMKWMWDVSKIESETNATLNVVALTQRKMANLKKEHQTLLALTSCLGHAFEIKKLKVAAAVMNVGEDSSDDAKVIEEFLAVALKEGYLEGPSGENQQYRWIHDSIQEAALSLIPENETIKFKYDVGKSLLQALSGKELDKSLFVVVGLLNPYAHEVGGLSESEKEILATLNLAAAKRSMKLSAFVSTCNFAKLGISLVPANRWETHHRVTLKLYTIACEAEAYRLNEKEMKEYGSEVIKQESVALFDKMRVYRAQLSFLGLGERNRGKEAVELCLEVLEQLGCTFPKTELMRTAKLISSLMKHKRDLPKRTAEEVASLPVLSSRRHREIDSILSELGIYAYTAGQTTLSGLCTMKQTSMTLKYGIHDTSYKGFCSLAPFFMVAFGDLKATDQVAQYSRFLKERVHGQKVVPGFCMMQGSFSLPWTHHWTTTIKVLTDGFETGIQEGELRNANYCVSAGLIASFFSGTNLDKLLNEIKMSLQYTNDLNIGVPLKDILILQRCVEMLLETGSNTSSDGEPSLLDEYKATVKGEDFTLAILYVFQGYIYYARGDHEACSALAQKTGILLDKLLSYFANMPVLYHQALSLYACAQKSSILTRRKLKGLASKRHKILRGWAKDGCCNVLHYVAILDAELAILNGEAVDKVEDLYQKAIVLSARGGFVQDAAVGNERLAGYFQDRGERVEAGRRFEQSIRYFEEWGFTRKARRLGAESNDLISSWSFERKGGL